MDFPVDDSDELKDLGPGDKITFTLNVTQDRDWVSNIRRIGHTNSSMTGTMTMDDTGVPKLKPGDTVPDGELIAEDGRHIHLSDFRGKAVALTFFFTRCPLPNYCPLMNRNFSQTRDSLLADSTGPTNWEFLSISFDSEFRPTNKPFQLRRLLPSQQLGSLALCRCTSRHSRRDRVALRVSHYAPGLRFPTTSAQWS